MGEGKTTISIGLLDAFYEIGKKAALSLREPSMGPVFGKKGGATGAGKAQIIPADEINLHFTGDLHAITYANNLICALVDNHIHQHNKLQINPKTITIKRCMDINDRALRNVVIGLGKPTDGVTRTENFNITAASELMAILCLANDYNELKNKISNILIGFSFDNQPIYVKDLKIQGAITAVLKHALKPNLVQTLAGNPVLVHGGPFANIAHGCCSIIATKLALKLSEFAITEAGFGADLGAEKFFNIKCRIANLKPNCVVLVATIKALIYHGKKNSSQTSITAILKTGLNNLKKHIQNLRLFNVEVIVTINKFQTDSNEHLNLVKNYCVNELNCLCEICDVFKQGGLGAINLAEQIVNICQKTTNKFQPLYELNSPLATKIETICKKIYGAKEINFTSEATKKLNTLNQINCSNLPICVCKSPYNFLPQTINESKTEANDTITICDIYASNGAGFVCAISQQALTMPGFSAQPAATSIDLDESGTIIGIN